MLLVPALGSHRWTHMSLKIHMINPYSSATFALLVGPTHGINGHAKEPTMTDYPYILFNKSLEQCRQLGARGGKASACNRRFRLWAESQLPRQIAAAPHDPDRETAAAAMALLDAQFPWLRGAEKQRAARRPSAHRPLPAHPIADPGTKVSPHSLSAD